MLFPEKGVANQDIKYQVQANHERSPSAKMHDQLRSTRGTLCMNTLGKVMQRRQTSGVAGFSDARPGLQGAVFVFHTPYQTGPEAETSRILVARTRRGTVDGA